MADSFSSPWVTCTATSWFTLIWNPTTLWYQRIQGALNSAISALASHLKKSLKLKLIIWSLLFTGHLKSFWDALLLTQLSMFGLLAALCSSFLLASLCFLADRTTTFWSYTWRLKVRSLVKWCVGVSLQKSTLIWLRTNSCLKTSICLSKCRLCSKASFPSRPCQFHNCRLDRF